MDNAWRREATLKHTGRNQLLFFESTEICVWPSGGQVSSLQKPQRLEGSGSSSQISQSFQKQSARVVSPDHDAAGRIRRKAVWPLEQLPLWP